MDGSTAKLVRRAVPRRDPALMLASLYPTSDESARLLQAMLDFVPGAREFLLRFGHYVQDLPDPGDPARTIFECAVGECLTRLDPLGLSPLTVQAHLAGFPVVVRTAVDFSDRAFLLSVVDARGAPWNPLSGPLASFSPHGPVFVAPGAPPEHRPDRRLSTLTVLGHCLGFPQVAILAGCWESVSAAPC